MTLRQSPIIWPSLCPTGTIHNVSGSDEVLRRDTRQMPAFGDRRTPKPWPRSRPRNRESRLAPHSTATCSISSAKISEGRRHYGICLSTGASYWPRAGVESARRRWSTRCNERTGFSLRMRAQTECVRDSAPFQLAKDPFYFLSGGLISSMLYIILLNDAHNREAGGTNSIPEPQSRSFACRVFSFDHW